MAILIAFSVLFFATFAASDVRPLPVTWDDSKKFGPDGPWNTVVVGVGTGAGAAQVNLYPGGSFDSAIFTIEFCNGTTAGCDAAEAGLYNPDKSPTADYQSIGIKGGISSWNSEIAMNMTGQGVLTLDTMTVSSASTAYPMPNVVFNSVISTNQQLPNGSFYNPRVGCLALGSPNPVQTFLNGNGSNVTGNLLTGYLRQNNDIPSSSFGLHIGSALLGLQGSLILGGYDKARALGDVGSFDTDGSIGEPVLDMIDATIDVETGGTPFNTSNIGSLFQADGNSSVAMRLDPVVPYMFLPPGMCEAIARWLPVSYMQNTGLWAWNTNDYRYESIITSPTFLSFTFQQSTSQNLTIKVPMSLLNLTLDTPLVAKPQPYFPCKTLTTTDGKWFLGRAFLQAAYLAINWEQNKFFLAQAAGPSVGPSSISAIQPADTSIDTSPTDSFLNTWKSVWTILPANTSSDAANATSPDGSPVPGSGGNGLSTGAKVGVAVGVVVGVLAILGCLLLLFIARRRRRQRRRHPLVLSPEENRNDKLEAEKSIENAGAFERGVEDDVEDRQMQDKYGLGSSDFRGAQLRHELGVEPSEMDTQHGIAEANPQSMVHEAPNQVAHEIGTSETATSGTERPRQTKEET